MLSGGQRHVKQDKTEWDKTLAGDDCNLLERSRVVMMS